jgi:methionine synthase II (cobalamin-independent)
MPHTDIEEACALIVKYLPSVPAWPQLNKLSFQEDMYVQFSGGFPGIVIDEEKRRVWVERSRPLDNEIEQLYLRYIENKFDDYEISPDHAAGINALLSMKIKPLAVKGQITGPVTLGLGLVDEDRRSIIHDEVLADALAKHLHLKASWQEAQLRTISPNTIIFLDEPYMVSFGSAFFASSREQVIILIDEVFDGITGLKGIHCCGNTDWSVVLSTKLDILNFDAYNYAESLTLYPKEIKTFLQRGGIIAWGIVPNEEENILAETASSLQNRLEEAMAPFTRKGIPFHQLIEQSMLTSSCGLAGISTEAAGDVLRLLSELSIQMRKQYIT